MVALLETSVKAYGDVVTALLTDLVQAGQGMEKLAWMAGSRALLEHEESWRSAVEQLRWWDSFLAGLPFPRLLSESRELESRRLAALHAGARLEARDAALRDHQRAVDEALERPDLTEAARDRLEEAFENPVGEQWLVDVAAYERRATAGLPPLPDPVPITVEDLDAATSFSGFNAIQAMRAHPDLGARARWMDEALAGVLTAELHLPPRAARHHAARLTDIFWLALRRALDAGSHQLAISVELLASAEGQAPVQERFTRELLKSWLCYLEALPMGSGDRRRRLPLLGALFRRPVSQDAAPRQLTDASAPGLWSRLRGALSTDKPPPSR